MANNYRGRGRGGRGRGNGRGRGGGRGRGRGNGGKNNNKNKAYQPPMLFDVQTNNKPKKPFNTVNDKFQKHIAKNVEDSEDLVTAIRTGKRVEIDKLKPVRQISTNPDANAAAIEQKGFDIEYDNEHRAWLARQKQIPSQERRGAAILMDDFCTQAMRNRLRDQPDYDTFRDDPIKLLELIKELAHNPNRATYMYDTVSRTIANLVNFRMGDLHPREYQDKYKQHKDLFKQHFGTSIFEHYVKQTPEYQNATTAEAKQKLLDDSFESFCAYQLLRGLNMEVYGSLLEGLKSQLSLGNDQFPKTVDKAMDAILKHTPDNKDSQKKNKRDKNNRHNRPSDDQEEKEEEEEAPRSVANLSFAQLENICWCCGKKGHKSDKCRHRSKPREDWVMTKAVAKISAYQEPQPVEQVPDFEEVDTQSVTSTRSAPATTSSRRSGRSQIVQTIWGFQVFQYGAHHSFQQSKNLPDLKEVLILDTGSTLKATVCNPELLHNIRPAKKKTIMNTNAGSKLITLEGDMPGVGVSSFDPTQLANILGFSHLADKHRITYDSAVEDAFFIHFDDKNIIKFTRSPDGLYIYKPKPTKPSEIAISNLIASVEDNKKGFSKRQIRDAEIARKLQRNLGVTEENLHNITRWNRLQGNPITSDDIKTAAKIFGPDIPTLRGKETRKQPPRVKIDIIDIPRELILNNHTVELCIDIMYVCKLPFLTGVDKTIIYRSGAFLDSVKSKHFSKALQTFVKKYNRASFKVSVVHIDLQFKTLVESSEKDFKGIFFNLYPKGDHVPEAERNNRVIQERTRVRFHALPYKAVPKAILKAIVLDCTRKLNFFPAKGGISSEFAPHDIMGDPRVTYAKDCVYEAGDHIQAHANDERTNTMEPRTLDCAYLRAMANAQGGHLLLDVGTGREITRTQVTPVPLNKFFVQRIEEIGRKDGISELKFQNRRKELYPADFAGVESDQNVEDNHNQDEESSEDEDEEEPFEEEIPEEDEEEDFEDLEPDEIERLEEDAKEDPIPVAANPTASDQQPGRAASTAATRTSTRSRAAPKVYTTDRLGFTQVREKATMKKVKFIDVDKERLEIRHNLFAQVSPNPDLDCEYTPEEAIVIARCMSQIQEKVSCNAASFVQQYILQKGLKKFGQRGADASQKELDQLHRRQVFAPISIDDLSPTEIKKAQEALMFLAEKRDGIIKGRMVYNGKPTREYIGKDESASPTATLESIFITAVIDAKERRDVMTADVPNAFCQTPMPVTEDGKDRVIMKITGVLVDLLVELNPTVYGPYVVYEKGRKVLYVLVLRAIYGMLESSLLWFRKFSSDLKKIGFKFNPYDPCVANKVINNKQHTIRWHVDDVCSSHVDPQVNDKFLKWLNEKYGSYGEVKAKRGKIHEFLGMTFDWSEKGKVKIGMIDYVKEMIEEFPIKITKTKDTPAAEDLLAVGTGEKLEKGRAEQFHTTVAKGLFICKRARPDIQPTISVLCTRVKAPNESDWKKVIRLLEYLNGTRQDVLTLSADKLNVIKWYVDASFAVHPDFKSHTGGVMTFGTGAVQSLSKKQKINTKSSTTAELVGADDASTLILWTKLFMEAQGYNIDKNILYQDNKSAILLEVNGKKSSTKRTRAMDIRYFFLTDQIEQGNLSVEYCPTDEMVGDFMTKPVQGAKYQKFRAEIMGFKPIE